MKNNYLIVFFLVLFSATATVAQQNQRPTCGTTEYMNSMISNDPGVSVLLDQLENATSELRTKNITYNSAGRAVITIPTVVHVIYRTSAENISDARINSQIVALNNDFGRMNADTSNTPSVFAPLGADTEIRFELAKRDPFGNATTGITRTQTTVNSFSTNNSVKYDVTGGKNVWDRNQFLNIWICNLGPFLLGYAQFPGLGSATDGVVLGYQYVGTTGASFPYNKGRTATHEIGHWLNLRHIWGDSNCGSDLVNDTPTQFDENYGCPTFPTTSGCSGNPPNGDMFMNYMDYTDDRCMNIFTNDQKTRMNDAIMIARTPILTSPGLIPPSTGISGILNEQAVNIYPNPAKDFVNIRFQTKVAEDVLLSLYNVLGELVIQVGADVNGNNEVSIDVSQLNTGLYFLRIGSKDNYITRRLTINK